MTRVLLIGLDGADPELTARWMGEGRLPHLQALAAHGAFAPLRGVVPPVTYPAWTTCVTGVNPGRHGIVDFTTMVPGRYAIRFLNSADRKAPALWNILSDAGKRVCVLGVPGAYPPEPVNGVFLSGFDSPVADGVDRSCVYPAAAWPRVRRWRFAPFQEHRITPDWYGAALRLLGETITEKTEIAGQLLEEEPWDFFMAVFGEADTASHHFWPLEDARSPRRRADSNAPEHPIRRVYERLDGAVGALAAAAGPDALVMVVSDHGFGGAGVETVHLNNLLAEYGCLRYGAAHDAPLKRWALRLLPARGRGALFRRFRGAATRVESRARFGGIDWRHTRAWSDELDYFPSLRVNLEGREPGGIVPRKEYESAVAELCALLETSPAVARALPRDAVYTGEWTTRAPDIIIELNWKDGYRYSCTRARGGPAIETLPLSEWRGGKERGNSGVHRNPALFIANRKISRDAPALTDMAPSALQHLNVPAPHMEGTALFGYDKGDGGNESGWTPPPEKQYTEEQENVLEGRMRSLGYYE
ncbi:MAG TPA: hypothetical protein ENN29_09060 [Candidatus Hydrogenedentes bacterium]|nr:hypothetical protein [Candidatus Hydrogenedentota bacterium]